MTQDTTPTEQDKTPKPEDETLKGKETPPVKGKTTPKEEPKTLTIVEAEKLAQLARMDAGRERKDMEVERDTVKAQLATKESELEDVVAEREKLKTDIDDLASGDPTRFNIIKKDRDLIERERRLKTGIQTLEADRQAHGDRVKLAENTLREVSIWETAAKHEGGDPVRLKDLCDTFGATTEEQITKVAETLWPTTKSQEPKTPPLKPFSGRTSGGSEDLSELSGRQLIKEGLDEQARKE